MVIKNPISITNLSDIKIDTQQTADCIITTNTYPNGFVLKTIQYADIIEIQSNRPLIKIDDDTFQIPD